MTTAQVVELSVTVSNTYNSPIQVYVHPEVILTPLMK